MSVLRCVDCGLDRETMWCLHTAADCRDALRRRVITLTAERDEARNARDHYMDVWNEQCAHVREACEMLGCGEAIPDSWTLREFAARVVKERDEARGLLGEWVTEYRANVGDDAAEADTTRREWEVRAATSYAAGRKAGLREAAEVCDVVSRTGEQIAWVYAADTLARRIRALVSAAETRDEGES